MNQSPHALEIAYWISQIAMALVVAGGAWIAMTQLRLLARQSKSSFLVELDRRWESVEMLAARSTARLHRQKLEAAVMARHGDKPEEVQRECYKEISRDMLADVRVKSPDEYAHFLQIWGFLETVGHLVRNNYVDISEIHSVFGHVILQCDDVSRLHHRIREADESKKVGRETHLFDNYINLADKLRAYQGNQSIGRPRIISRLLRKLSIHKDKRKLSIHKDK